MTYLLTRAEHAAGDDYYRPDISICLSDCVCVLINTVYLHYSPRDSRNLLVTGRNQTRFHAMNWLY